jgi:predicted nucleic acid-binding protein
VKKDYIAYDSSALLNLIRSAGGDAVEYSRGNYILTLTPYEVGNALWKETTLLNRLSMDEALALIQYIANVYRIMNITAAINVSLVFKLANKIKVTLL